MNIFYTDKDPGAAARSLPDKHVVKMPVETVQILVSALLRYGIQPQVVTSRGAIHKGGYHYHPSTVWAGDTRANATWLWQHGMGLCSEYSQRYGKTHFAEGQLMSILSYLTELPAGDFTPPTLAMPDECKTADPVESYRNYIRAKVATKPKSFVWNKGTAAPAWL